MDCTCGVEPAGFKYKPGIDTNVVCPVENDACGGCHEELTDTTVVINATTGCGRFSVLVGNICVGAHCKLVLAATTVDLLLVLS